MWGCHTQHTIPCSARSLQGSAPEGGADSHSPMSTKRPGSWRVRAELIITESNHFFCAQFCDLVPIYLPTPGPSWNTLTAPREGVLVTAWSLTNDYMTLGT